MVYDNSEKQLTALDYVGHVPGFSIQEAPARCTSYKYEIYTDDGYGAGDFIAATYRIDMAKHIARLLDINR